MPNREPADLLKTIFRSFVLATLILSMLFVWFEQRLLKLPLTGYANEDKAAIDHLEPDVSRKRTCDQLVDRTDRQIFQPVDEDNHTYVFSAYYDDYTKKGESKIRIIGMTYIGRNPNKTRPQMYCYIRLDASEDCISISAVYRPMPANQGEREYTGTYFLCPLPQELSPVVVSLVSGSQQGPLFNVLSVQMSRIDNLNFTLCVAPLHSSYNNSVQLVEFLEVNRLFGANLLIVYNYSISSYMDYILRQLQQDKVVEIVNFPLPPKVMFGNVRPQIHYYGQNIAINDCMYRYAKRTKFILNTDLDEFIVPMKAENWSDLVEQKIRRNTTWPIGEFQSRTSMFFTFYADHPKSFPGKEEAWKYKVVTLLKTSQDTYLYPKNKKSKCIYDPKRVETAGIHRVIKFIKPYKRALFSPEEAVTHHYRDAPFLTSWARQSTATHLNTRMHKFKDTILSSIKKRWATLSHPP